MDIRHLTYFIEVARQKSFSKVAETTHVSQPTISKAVKELENELNITLFYRNSKNVKLTDMGEMLFSRAISIVEAFQNITTEFAISEPAKGKINIGLPPITAATIFAKLLAEFKAAYPGIDIVLFEYGSKAVEIGIQDGSLDMGLICHESKKDAYNSIHFIRDPLKLVVHVDHPLSRCSNVSFADLADQSFVLYRQDFSLHDDILARCQLEGFKPKIIVKTSQRELMIQLVANGLAVTLLPSKICEELDPMTMTSVPLDDPQVFLKLSLIWDRKRYLSQAAHLWLKFVEESFLDKP